MYPNNVYVMGDIHGDFRPVRDFWLRNKIQIMKRNEKPVLILLGDAGLNYFFNHRDEQIKKKLGTYPFTYFVVRGNHEERPSNCIKKFPDKWEKETFWNNTVYVEKEYPYIKYAEDGPAVYEIPYWTGDYNEGTEEDDWCDEGEPIIKTYKTLVLPGAYSVDKSYRLMMGYSWFKDEQMTADEKELAWDIIRNNKYKFDVILSHTCPCIFEPTDLFLSFIDQSMVDKDMERFLGAVEYALEDYTIWLWGHYHAFRDYPRTDGKKKIMLFNKEAINLNQVIYSDNVEKL